MRLMPAEVNEEMNRDDLQPIREWFELYVHRLLPDLPYLPQAMQMKWDHCLRVAEDSLLLASLLDWNDQELVLAENIGLLHDVGRFAQYSRYKTFHDPISINHAALGWEIMKDSPVLSAFPSSDRPVLLDAIHYHNLRSLPLDLTPVSSKYLRLIQDTDKLDIFLVAQGIVDTNKVELYREMMPHIDFSSLEVNPVLLAEIKERNIGSSKYLRSLADVQLMLLSWIFGFYYDQTYKIFAQRGILDKLVATLPDSQPVQDVVNIARDYLGQKVG